MLTDVIERKNIGAISDWFAALFLVVGIVAIVLMGLAAGLTLGTFAGGFRVLALTLLLASASGVCGWVMGLLFGVPRTLSRPGTASPPPTASPPGSTAPVEATPSIEPTSYVNTNLEDISDWLTKTIVGVGLTQLYAAPAAIWKTALLLDEHGMSWAPYGPLLSELR